MQGPMHCSGAQVPVLPHLVITAQECVVQVVLDNINEDTFGDYLDVASSHRLERLEAKCIDYLLANFNKVRPATALCVAVSAALTSCFATPHTVPHALWSCNDACFTLHCSAVLLLCHAPHACLDCPEKPVTSHTEEVWHQPLRAYRVCVRVRGRRTHKRR